MIETFSIQLGALRAAVALVARAVQRRHAIPVLEHIHLAAEGGCLTVTGTDLERWLTTSVDGDGALRPITVSPARLLALLARLPAEETVTLSRAKEGQLTVEAPPIKARLYTLPAEDMPPRPEIAPEASWGIAAGRLLRLIETTQHAISTEETRYYLNGIFLHAHQPADDSPWTLRATTTDGRRLMLADQSSDEIVGGRPLAQILPRSLVLTLRALLAALPPERVVDVQQRGCLIFFAAGRWMMQSKTIDGTFPDYTRPHIIPPPDEGELLTVEDPARFADAIATVTAVSAERSRPVRLSNGSGTTLRLEARGAESGDCELTVPSDVAAWRSNGHHPEVGFQARYLLDLCRVYARGKGGFTMRLRDGSAPTRIDGDAGTAVLMPMRV